MSTANTQHLRAVAPDGDPQQLLLGLAVEILSIVALAHGAWLVGRAVAFEDAGDRQLLKQANQAAKRALSACETVNQALGDLAPAAPTLAELRKIERGLNQAEGYATAAVALLEACQTRDEVEACWRAIDLHKLALPRLQAAAGVLTHCFAKAGA